VARNVLSEGEMKKIAQTKLAKIANAEDEEENEEINIVKMREDVGHAPEPEHQPHQPPQQQPSRCAIQELDIVPNDPRLTHQMGRGN